MDSFGDGEALGHDGLTNDTDELAHGAVSD